MTKMIILDKIEYNIILENDIFNVNILSDEKYNEKGFEEFLYYFKTTWEYIRDNNMFYFLLINMGKAKNGLDLPLFAYIKLIQHITELNNIIAKHCHSICLFTENIEKWQATYNLITNLWNPPEQRPMLFTSNKQEIDMFFHSNKIIPVTQ